MPRFTLDAASPLPPEQAWAALWDLDAHTALIPLTTVTGELGQGGCFVARTAWGPLGFDDPMEVVEWSPPGRAAAGGGPSSGDASDGSRAAGRATIVKHGRLVRGRIDVTIRATGTGPGSLVHWDQEIAVSGFGVLPDVVTATVARTAYGRILRRLLAGKIGP